MYFQENPLEQFTTEIRVQRINYVISLILLTEITMADCQSRGLNYV